MNHDNEKRPAVVFDFGGVLVDWNPLHLYQPIFDGDRAAAERFLAEIGFAEWNVRLDDGHQAFSDAVEELAARFPQHRALIRAYDERWTESVAGPIGPTVDILDALREAGVPLYGLSNWSAEKFPLIRRRYPFFDWFQAIVVSGEVKLVKPDPRIFSLLLDRIGRPANECVYVDDAEANIAAARRMGFQAIHFKSPEQLRAELRGMSLLQ